MKLFQWIAAKLAPQREQDTPERARERAREEERFLNWGNFTGFWGR